MVEGIFSPIDMRERTARSVWKSPEQGEEVVDRTMASRLDLAMGRGWGKRGRER